MELIIEYDDFFDSSTNEPTKKSAKLQNVQKSHTTYFKISTKTGEKSLLALNFGYVVY